MKELSNSFAQPQVLDRSSRARLTACWICSWSAWEGRQERPHQARASKRRMWTTWWCSTRPPTTSCSVSEWDVNIRRDKYASWTLTGICYHCWEWSYRKGALQIDAAGTGRGLIWWWLGRQRNLLCWRWTRCRHGRLYIKGLRAGILMVGALSVSYIIAV